jgi:hypothetical protein
VAIFVCPKRLRSHRGTHRLHSRRARSLQAYPGERLRGRFFYKSIFLGKPQVGYSRKLDNCPNYIVALLHGLQLCYAATEAIKMKRLSCSLRIQQELSLLSGQKMNSSNWLLPSASSDWSAVAEIADWIDIFSNTVTEKICSNV